jgi:2-dehydro-3-deoxyphosphogluconate aldolase/(4S)-4-hydroxy-2-oxoglutarate aldolase
MRSKADVISSLTESGVIAVVRAGKPDDIVPVAEALVAGGVIAVEVTMTTPNAIEAIREASDRLGPLAVIGVGTVLNVPTCRAALDAGAQFVVSPIVRPELVPLCQAAKRPVMLGAYTPTEAQLAHEAGSDFIKIFPSDGLGPAYIRALRAPLPHLQIIPTGIARATDIPEFIKAGCVAVGLGSLLVSAPILRDHNWVELTRLARSFVSMVREARAAR